MGLNVTKSSLTNTDYWITLSSTNNVYRGRSSIHGELGLHARTKLRIEKKIRVDLIGVLIERQRFSPKRDSRPKDDRVFFTYSFPLVTSHQNGIARTIKQQQIAYPFRIPLGVNLPPSCEFSEFAIVYYLDIYHDERLLPNIRKRIILAPPALHIHVPPPCRVTDLNDITMICSLQKSSYSGRDGAIVPLSICISNFGQTPIKSLLTQLIQTVSLNGAQHENEIFTSLFNEIDVNIQDNQIKTTLELSLPPNLPPTHVPNENCQPDNVPSVAIAYELRVAAQMRDAITSSLHLSVPIGVE